MNSKKMTSESRKSAGQLGAGRRSFMWKAGTAMTAVLASAAAGVSKNGSVASDSNGEAERLSRQLGILEDANAIRSLHQAYESFLDRGLYDELTGMFTADAEVVYNGGSFVGKEGIRRLYCGCFATGCTGKKIGPAPGFEPDAAQQVNSVEVAEDRQSATGRFPYSMQVGAALTGDSSLLDMARLHGEGIVFWWEGGIHEVFYVKTGDSWKIKKLEYRSTSKADYRPGRSYAKPITVAAFSRRYPEDPAGPDRLV